MDTAVESVQSLTLFALCMGKTSAKFTCSIPGIAALGLVMKGSRKPLRRNTAIVSPEPSTHAILPDRCWLIPQLFSSSQGLIFWLAPLSGTKPLGAGPENRTREVLLGAMHFREQLFQVLFFVLFLTFPSMAITKLILEIELTKRTVNKNWQLYITKSLERK